MPQPIDPMSPSLPRLTADCFFHVARACTPCLPTLYALSRVDHFFHGLCERLLYETVSTLDNEQRSRLACAHAPYEPPRRLEHTQPKSTTTTKPVVLRAAAEGRVDTLALYERLSLHPRHVTVAFRTPIDDGCRSHWPWTYRTLPGQALPAWVAHAMPLHLASQNGHDDAVLWLLKRDLNSGKINQLSTLTCICPSRHVEILQVMHNIRTPHDAPLVTALDLTIAHAHLTTAKVLIEAGADWWSANEHAGGVSALHLMCANGRHELLWWLASTRPDDFGRAADLADDVGMTMLHYLVMAPAETQTQQRDIWRTMDVLTGSNARLTIHERRHWGHDADEDYECEAGGWCSDSPLSLAALLGKQGVVDVFSAKYTPKRIGTSNSG